MSVEDSDDRQPDATPPPLPFADQPQDPAALRGCSPKVLLGCGAAVLIVAVLFLVLIAKAPDLFEWAFEQQAQTLLEALPPDVTSEEEERLRRALDGASRAVTEGRVDVRGLQDFLDALSLATEKGQEMTRQDVIEATEALERVSATPPRSGASLGRPAARLAVA